MRNSKIRLHSLFLIVRHTEWLRYSKTYTQVRANKTKPNLGRTQKNAAERENAYMLDCV